MSITGAVILAAGGSSRFGETKQLARVGDAPLVAHAVRAACGARELDPIVVVLGAEAERVRAVLPAGRQQVVVNEHWQNGIASSLREGLRALGHVDAVLVLHADQPLVDTLLIRVLLAFGLPEVTGPAPTADAARPVADRIPEYPALLGSGALARLGELAPDDGFGPLLPPERVALLPIETADTLLDVDLPEDLEVAERAWRERRHPMVR